MARARHLAALRTAASHVARARTVLERLELLAGR